MIHSICLDFESQINSDKEFFKALYFDEPVSFKEEEQDNINRMHAKLKDSIKEFQKKINVLLRQKTMKDIITYSLEIEKKLDLNQISKEIDGTEFNPEKYPGLLMKTKNPNATVLIFSNGKIVITDMKNISEADQVVDVVLKKIRKLGIEIHNPKIDLESTK